MLNEKLKQHILLHLRDAKRHIEVKDLKQVEHNIFEIANHLEITDKQVSADLWLCRTKN